MPHRLDLEDGRFMCQECGFSTILPNAADQHWFDTMTRDERSAYEQREKERKSHAWVTLDGENFSCSWCDSKTGNGMCPGAGPQDPDDFGSFATTTEREADQITDAGRASYEDDGGEPF